MSQDHPDQLSAALRRIAGQSVPATADPAGTVRQKAGRLRTRRIAGTAAMGAAAVALVVPVGIALFPDAGQQGHNVATTNTAPATSQTTKTKPVPQATPGQGRRAGNEHRPPHVAKRQGTASPVVRRRRDPQQSSRNPVPRRLRLHR